MGSLAGCFGGGSSTGGDEKKPELKMDDKFHWYEGKEGEKEKHKFEYLEDKTVESTCTKKGSKTKKCTVCGKEVPEELNFANHVLSVDTNASTAATCSQDGSTVEKCANCEFTKTTPIDKTAHSFGEGVSKSDDAGNYLEFECATCHAKGTNRVAFNTVEVDGDTATSGKLPSTAGAFGTWKVSLPAGEYDVYLSAKYSSSGAGYKFAGENSRGIEVKYNDANVTFDGDATEVTYGLTTNSYTSFSFFKITATGGIDTLAISNPYYRLVFDVTSYITFIPYTNRA